MNFHKGLMLLLLAAVFAMPSFGQEEAKKENWLEKRFGKELVNAKGEKVSDICGVSPSGRRRSSVQDIMFQRPNTNRRGRSQCRVRRPI